MAALRLRWERRKPQTMPSFRDSNPITTRLWTTDQPRVGNKNSTGTIQHIWVRFFAWAWRQTKATPAAVERMNERREQTLIRYG